MPSKTWFIFALLCGLTFALYSPCLNGPFIYDDHRQIVNNENLHQISDPSKIIFNGVRHTRIWQNASFALNWVMGDGDVSVFRLTNLALHLINAALVLLFLIRIPGMRRDLALLTTALFLIHPLQFQSVGYVMGRISLIQAFFFFAVLVAYQAGARTALVAMLILLATFAKESVLVIPLALIAYDLTLGGRALSRLPWRRYAAFVCAAAIYIPVALLIRDEASYKGAVGFGLFPYGEYLVRQAYYHLFNIFLVLNPAEQSFIHIYSPPSGSTYIAAAAALLIMVAAVVWAWKNRTRYPAGAFLVFFFFISLAPSGSFLQMKNPFAEYRLYQSDLSLFFAFAAGFLWLLQKVKSPSLRAGAQVAVLVGFAAFTLMQARLWMDAVDVYKYSLAMYPQSPELHVHVGAEYERKNMLNEAKAEYKDAVYYMHNDPLLTARPLYLLARMQLRTGEPEAAKATLEQINPASLTFGVPKALGDLKAEIEAALKK